jgi:hypothetical protein
VIEKRLRSVFDRKMSEDIMNASALLFPAALMQSATEDFSTWPSSNNKNLYVIAFFLAVAVVGVVVWMIKRNNQR